MAYLDSFGDLPPRDLAALTSIGWHRSLATYQLRELHFPTVSKAILARRLGRWRELQLIHSQRHPGFGVDVHSLTPSAIDALRSADIAVDELDAFEEMPRCNGELSRTVVANDLFLAIGRFAGATDIGVWWQLAHDADPAIDAWLLPDVVADIPDIACGTVRTCAFTFDDSRTTLKVYAPKLRQLSDALTTTLALDDPLLVVLVNGDRRVLALRSKLERTGFPHDHCITQMPRRVSGPSRVHAFSDCVASVLHLPVPNDPEDDEDA